jgi:hypothetical protein
MAGRVMTWEQVSRNDPRARQLADRHYNRQKIGSSQFAPPGNCFVLYTKNENGGEAFWITSWQKYTLHAWDGAWVCSAFRNENAGIAQDLIYTAIQATKWYWPNVPNLGMITFINEQKVTPTIVRGKLVFGWTFRKIGFEEVGRTKINNLLVLQLLPEKMPESSPPIGVFHGF